MSLSVRERRSLARLERSLAESDGHLVRMASMFTRLTRGEAMPERERLRSNRGWLLMTTVLPLVLIVVLIATASGRVMSPRPVWCSALTPLSGGYIQVPAVCPR